MNLNSLKERIDALQTEYDTLDTTSASNRSLQDNLVVQYNKNVLRQLADIVKQKNATEQTVIAAFDQFLFKNWEKINGTALAYTALPVHPVTDLLCDIASFVAEKKQEMGEKIAPIQVLMPTVCIKHLTDPTKNLNLLELKTALETHALGFQGQYLIPVEVLTQLDCTSDLTKVPNVYFDTSSHSAELEYLNASDLTRLENHNAVTQSFFDIKRKYDLFVFVKNDTNSLLDQLKKLMRLMIYDSSHDGIDTAEVAVKGGMTAVFYFFEYYNSLSAEQQEKIPEDVKSILEDLRSFAPPKKDLVHKKLPLIFMKKYQETVELKIIKLKHSIQRREHADIEKMRRDVEIMLAALAAIDISAETKTRLLQETISPYTQRIAELKKLLEERQHQHGADKFGITKKILGVINVDFTPRDIEDLAMLSQLTAAEITEICSIRDAPKKIITAIGSIENLVILISTLSAEKLSALLQGIKTPIKNLIRNPKDLTQTLVNLQPDTITVVMQGLKDHLLTMFDNKQPVSFAQNVALVLRDLFPVQCKRVCEALIGQLRTTIEESHDDVLLILSNLDDDQCKVVCDVIINDLSNILSNTIKNVSDYKVLRYFTDDQRKTFFDKIEKDRLPTRMQSMQDLRMLNILPIEQCKVVCEASKDYLCNEVSDCLFSFCQRLGLLSKNTCDVVYEVVQDSLIAQSQTLNDFASVFYQLPVDSHNKFYAAVKERLFNRIQKANDLRVLAVLSDRQLNEVFEDIKDRLPDMFTSANDLHALRFLSVQQRNEVFEAIKDRLPDMFASANDWDNWRALEYLSGDKNKEALEILNLSGCLSAITEQNLALLYPSQNVSHITYDNLEKIAVKKFLAHPDVSQSDFWKKRDPEKVVTAQMIIQRAKTQNSSQFFTENTSNETKKLLTDLRVICNESIDENAFANRLIVALLHFTPPSAAAAATNQNLQPN